VYADPREAEADRGIPRGPIGAVFHVTQKVPLLLERQAPLEFTLVERQPKGRRRRVLPA
jgi:hypothetical protein